MNSHNLLSLLFYLNNHFYQKLLLYTPQVNILRN